MNAIEEERQKCCRDICRFCREYIPVERIGMLEAARWVHTYNTPCKASNIRERAYLKTQNNKAK
jgi:hypothetical protein